MRVYRIRFREELFLNTCGANFLFNLVINLFKSVDAPRDFKTFTFFKSGKYFYFTWHLNFQGFGPVGSLVWVVGGTVGKKEEGQDSLWASQPHPEQLCGCVWDDSLQ